MDLTGNTIDNRYELQAQLGQGGMGAVYRARDNVLARDVALKMLIGEAGIGGSGGPEGSGADNEYHRRFSREAKLLASLNCPYVVKFLGWGLWQKSAPYLVMELLDGTSLTDYLATNSRLNWRDAFRIGIQICNGLEAVHNADIVHRDISPSNIFLCNTDPFEIKIIDLGLANRKPGAQTAQLTETGRLMGSLHYMSPEMCAGQRPEAQSDIYALGCILYELISGRKAIDADNPMALVYKHANEYPPKLNIDKDIPAEVDQVLFRAMSKHKQQRYQTATEMKTDLQACLDGLPLLEQDSPAVKPNYTLTQGRIALCALAVVIPISLAIFFSLLNQPTRTALPVPESQQTTQDLILRNDNPVKPFQFLRQKRVRATELERMLNKWIAYKPARKHKFFVLAKLYDEVAEAYRAEKTESETRRIEETVLSVLPKRQFADPSLETEKRAIALKCRSLIIGINQNIQNDSLNEHLLAYWHDLGGLKNVAKYRQTQDIGQVLYVDAIVALRRREWDRALEDAKLALVIPSGTYNFSFQIQMCRQLLTGIPDERLNDALNCSEATLRNLKKLLANSNTTVYESSDQFNPMIGLQDSQINGDEVQDEIYLFGNVLCIAELCVVNNKIQLAKEWLPLLQQKQKLDDKLLLRAINCYQEKDDSGKAIPEVVSILASVPARGPHKEATKESMVRAETIRLCAIYPRFLSSRSPKLLADEAFLDATAVLFEKALEMQIANDDTICEGRIRPLPNEIAAFYKSLLSTQPAVGARFVASAADDVRLQRLKPLLAELQPK